MPGTAFNEIPVVDLGRLQGTPAERAELAVELREICHHIGFFVAINHGVEPTLIDRVFDMMATFFALPTESKQTIDKLTSPHFRGWESLGSEYTNNRQDMREQIDIWTDWPPRPADVEPHYLRLLGPNQWPTDEVLPGLKPLIDEWYRELGGLSNDLLRVFSAGLGLDEAHLSDYFAGETMSLTKLISYPPTPAGQAGVNAHHDAGFITLLAAGPTPGLQVENGDGEWVDVPPLDGAFVVNLGEMLQGVTGNYFVATPHRVITAEPRLSAGYFHGPSLDASLEPWPIDPDLLDAVAASERHASAGFMASTGETESGVGDMQSEHRPSTYGEQLWNYFSRSYVANMETHYGQSV